MARPSYLCSIRWDARAEISISYPVSSHEMARVLFLILVGLHGLIHFMGPVKAFGLADIEALTQPISRRFGLLWLAAGVLFGVVAIQYARGSEGWWLLAIGAAVLSQALIITVWQDAKYGTGANLVVLIVALVAAAGFFFDREVRHEVNQLFEANIDGTRQVVTGDMLAELPPPVQRWMRQSGMVGRERIDAVRLRQELLLRMTPDTGRWTPAQAQQYVTTDTPAFIWTVDMHMLSVLPVAGRDRFDAGTGAMTIKLLSLFPVVDSKNNERINTGALQRYLGEMVWFPSAALSPYVTWEQVGEHAARATMSVGGTTDAGTFYFNEAGEVIRYSAMRYRGDDETAERRAWIIDVLQTREMAGLRIPTKMDVTWKLDEGDWTWLQLEVTDIAYNTPQLY